MSWLFRFDLWCRKGNSISRKRWRKPRPNPGSIPLLAHNSSQIAKKAAVIILDSILVFVLWLASKQLSYLYLQQPQEHHKTKERQKRHHRQEKLVEGQKTEHGADVRGQKTDRKRPPQMPQSFHDKLTVKQICIRGGSKHVQKQAEVVAMIGMANATAAEPAVMIAGQDANVTDLAVVASWRLVEAACAAVRPLAAFVAT